MQWLTWLLVVAVVSTVFVVLQRKSTESTSPPVSAEVAAAYDELARILTPAKRTTHDPVVEARDAEGPASKFGGQPWLPAGSAWPTCKGCERALTFFVQLNVASLPPEAGIRGQGLIQLFQCTNADSKSDVCMETWQHDSRSVAVRLVATAQGGGNAAPPHAEATWPARTITAWTAWDDFPHYEDLGLTEIEESDELLELDDAASGDDRTALNRPGDKLGGWPYWVQNPEYARCAECQKRMQLVLQIDSEDNIPYMFGDGGVGHLLQCPDHPHVLTWGWACH
jgi:uncharacterized protein YwqG